MKENIIKDKSFLFALRIVKLYRSLCDNRKEFVLSKQILRSGTSIGANIRESEHGQSKADFIHKTSIALKEANETDYWLELLYQSGYLDEAIYKSLKQDCEELLKILTAIVKSSKAN